MPEKSVWELTHIAPHDKGFILILYQARTTSVKSLKLTDCNPHSGEETGNHFFFFLYKSIYLECYFPYLKNKKVYANVYDLLKGDKSLAKIYKPKLALVK